MQDIESPLNYIDWGYYAMISSALQRRVWLGDSLAPLYPNMYVTLVGPPATGKGRVITQIKHIMTAPEMSYIAKDNQIKEMFIVGADATTWQSLVKDVAMSSQIHFFKSIKDDGKIVDDAYLHCSFTLLSEELGVLLNKEVDYVVNILNQAYDAGSLKYSTKTNGKDNIANVCLAILAGTNPDFLNRSLKSGIVEQGLCSRIVFVYEEKPRFFKDMDCKVGEAISPEQKQCRGDIMRHIKNLFQVYGPLRFSEEAKDFFRSKYETGSLDRERVNTERILDVYYGRKRVHWKKLAMVMHMSEPHTDMIITRNDLERALGALTLIELEMHKSFGFTGSNMMVIVAENIYRHLIQSGASNFVGLFKIFYKNVSCKAQLNEVLTFLIAAEKITYNSADGRYSGCPMKDKIASDLKKHVI